MKILEKIVIEKETVSDVDYKITEIYAQSGQEIKEGELIFSFETSKADIDIESPNDGVLIHSLKENSKVVPGEVVVVVVDSATEKEIEQIKHKYFNNEDVSNEPTNTETRISKKAMRLMKNNNLTEKDFSGKKIVKEKDVLELLSNNREALADMFNIDSLGTPKESDVIIIGGKGGAKMVIDAIRSTGDWNIQGIIDNNISPGELVMDIPVLGGEYLLEDVLNAGFTKIILSFSTLQNLKSRNEIYQNFKKRGFEFPNIIHQKATIEPSVNMGEGNIVLASAMIGSEVELGSVNYINTGALICHEAKIGDNNHFAPNSVIAGRVKIADNVLVGMCTTTFYDISIGSNSILNNGTNIIKNIPSNSIIKN